MAAQETATSTEVAAPSAGILAEVTAPLPALRTMLRTLTAEASLADPADDTFVMEIMERILTAKTEDDVFAAQEAGMISGQDFVARPFTLRESDIEIRKSTIEGGGLPVYALLRVTEIASGEEITLNCGGKTFMATLQALRQIGSFDETKYPDGRSLVLVGVSSPNGAYLQLKPFKRAESTGGKKK